jgi:hypothetical protein
MTIFFISKEEEKEEVRLEGEPEQGQQYEPGCNIGKDGQK